MQPFIQSATTSLSSAGGLAQWSAEFYLRLLPLIGLLAVPIAALDATLAARNWKLSSAMRWVIRWLMGVLWALLLVMLLGLTLARDTQPGPAEVLQLATSWADVLRLAFVYTTDTWPLPVWHALWFALFQGTIHLVLCGLTHVRLFRFFLEVAGADDGPAETTSAVLRSIVRSILVIPLAVIQLLGILLPVSG